MERSLGCVGEGRFRYRREKGCTVGYKWMHASKDLNADEEGYTCQQVNECVAGQIEMHGMKKDLDIRELEVLGTMGECKLRLCGKQEIALLLQRR